MSYKFQIHERNKKDFHCVTFCVEKADERILSIVKKSFEFSEW